MAWTWANTDHTETAMDPLSGDPYNPITLNDPTAGPAKRVPWWQALLIMAPFAILILLYLAYGKR